MIEVLSPGSGQEIAFDEPFTISGRATAPEGGVLERVSIVLSGATALERTTTASGASARFELELLVPGLERLGSDRLPLEARFVAIARVDGELTESEIVRVPLVAVDRTAPAIEILLDPPGQPLANFDAAYAPNTPFTLLVRATDPLGGIVRLTVRAPAFLGGARTMARPPAHRAEMFVAFDPPEHADLELVVIAEDAAAQPNLAERTVWIRVGNGGVDTAAPAVTVVAPEQAECGGTLAIAVAATDDMSGVERVTLEGEGLDALVLGPNPADPRSLVLNATIAVPHDRAVGSALDFSAGARDLAGNRAPFRSYRPQIADTLPPSLTAVLGADLSVVPGAAYSAVLIGRESCTVIEEAVATFDDGATTTSVAVSIGTETINERISFAVPETVCALEPIRTSITLIDRTGLAALGLQLTLPGTDIIPPRVALSANDRTALLGDTLSFDVVFSDLQTPVQSASVALSGVGLALGAPTLIEEAYPAVRCADRQERALEAAFVVPPDVRFLTPTGAVRVEAIVRDAAGNTRSEAIDVAISDLVAPELRLSAPSLGSVVLAGSTVPIQLFARDVNHDVASVSLTVFGPGSIGATGTTSATIAVQAASSTVTFQLLVDADAPLGAELRFVAIARDSGGLAPYTALDFTFDTCGAPGLVSISPNEGPAAGGFDVLIQGSGFDPATTTLLLGNVPLDAAVSTSTLASASVPAGTYPPETVDLYAVNDCGNAVVTATLAAAFTFVAPPVVELVRPRVGRTAEAGAELSAIVAAVAAGSALSRIEARIDDGALSSATFSGESGTLDAVLRVPDDASGSVTVLAAAIDRFGQRSETALLIPVETPAVRALELALTRSVYATGETGAYAVWVEDTSGATRDVTLSAAVSSNNAAVIEVDGAGAILALSTGSATITASFGGFDRSIFVRTVERALIFTHSDLFLSANAASALFVPEVLLLENGAASVVTATLTYSAGDELLTAALTDLSASIPQRLRVSLSIAAEERFFVPTGQIFDDASIAGTLVPWTRDAAEWRIDAATFSLAGTGRIEARGTFGRADGIPGTRVNGGGRGGAAGSGGEDSTNGGAGSASGGGGGGSAGSGGRGGAASGNLRALAGAGSSLVFNAGGGGGGSAGAGGNGGPRLVISANDLLILDGIIDAGGGAGGSALSGTSGGGGAGGVVILNAAGVLGRGTILVQGGAGGMIFGSGDRGTGGGGGGGLILIQSTGRQSPFLDVDLSGGTTSAALGDALPGEPGARGLVIR
jgi:hypothetical protein